MGRARARFFPRATKHTSESKRAKFRIGPDFRFTVLYNRVAMSLASTEHENLAVSVRFPLFQYQHSTNMVCFWVTRCLCKLYIDLLPSRLVLLGIILAYSAYTRKIAQNVQKSFAAGAPPQTSPGEQRPCQTPSRRAGDRIN